MSGEWRALYECCKKGSWDDAEYLVLNAKVDCNWQHPEIGSTPLLAAVEANDLAIVKLLVERGNADVNLEADCFSEGSPTRVAARKGFHDIEAYLISKGGLKTDDYSLPEASRSRALCTFL